jgi:hypothetical protein
MQMPQKPREKIEQIALKKEKGIPRSGGYPKEGS